MTINTALMMCTFGAAPCPLIVLPVARTMVFIGPPAGAILDFVPGLNIATFGMCMSLGNPAVAAATTAALGVLTPQPCMPATAAPWVPPVVTTMVGTSPAVSVSGKQICMFGGVIAQTIPGQFTTMLPM